MTSDGRLGKGARHGTPTKLALAGTPSMLKPLLKRGASREPESRRPWEYTGDTRVAPVPSCFLR
eukprot:scaffold99857_cov27-Tisochrysis_lutea.AAC.5